MKRVAPARSPKTSVPTRKGTTMPDWMTAQAMPLGPFRMATLIISKWSRFRKPAAPMEASASRRTCPSVC